MPKLVFLPLAPSDWNHGNAHFLRGVARGCSTARSRRPRLRAGGAWSARNLAAEQGEAALVAGAGLPGCPYGLRPGALDFERALDGADLCSSTNGTTRPRRADRDAPRAAGALRSCSPTRTTGSATDPEAMAAYNIDGYDGVLAFGAVLRDVYLRRGWGRRAFTWHEAADTPRVSSASGSPPSGANWCGSAIGATASEPRSCTNFWSSRPEKLGLRGAVHGVRYPAEARSPSTPPASLSRDGCRISDVPRASPPRI